MTDTNDEPVSDLERLAQSIRTLEEIRLDLVAESVRAYDPGDGVHQRRLAEVAAELRVVHSHLLAAEAPRWVEGPVSVPLAIYPGGEHGNSGPG